TRVMHIWCTGGTAFSAPPERRHPSTPHDVHRMHATTIARETPMAPERLSALDMAFLCLEGDATPMHMGAVATFRPRRGWNADRVADLLAERAARMPRLRRRVRTGPLPFSGAHWEDDPLFDPHRHVAVSSLYDRYAPDPLAAFAQHWIAEPLDLKRPLWSVQVVTGLP